MFDAVPICLASLFAFGFGDWGMLWFLTGAAGPILLHLWNRRRYREVTWAAMEYLLAAVRNNSRRIRVEQLILLVIRTLLVALLGLAVAEPFLDSQASWQIVLACAALAAGLLSAVLWLALFSRLRGGFAAREYWACWRPRRPCFRSSSSTGCKDSAPRAWPAAARTR